MGVNGSNLTEITIFAHAVALAFKAQIVDSVPMMEHDRRIDVLATADGVHRISERGQTF